MNNNQFNHKKDSSFSEKTHYQFNILSNICLPFRYIIKARDTKFYQRCLFDAIFAKKWAEHYLKDLKLSPGDKILDHGCGRGRVSALCNQLGFKTYAQDIAQHEWWHKVSNTTFQVVNSDFKKLPWQSDSFSAVLNFGVIHYMDEQSLEGHIEEVFRVLQPGGYYVLWEANHQSYGAWMPRKQIGRVHDIDLVKNLVKK